MTQTILKSTKLFSRTDFLINLLFLGEKVSRVVFGVRSEILAKDHS